MKKLLFLLTFAFNLSANGQSFDDDKTSFINFLKRRYTAAPFEGVVIVDDYDHQYLISVVSLVKANYTDPSLTYRVAQVKAQSQANTFLNGATISMDMVIKTSERISKDSTFILVESVERIKQNSMGFTQGLELLTNFENADSKRMVFIYIRKIIK